MELLHLFLTFLKIGAVSFGGGYGMIPLIQEEVIANGWMTTNEFLNFIAVAESTPGPIAVNMATFIGAGQFGFAGALLATLGVILPAFLIILLVVTLVSSLLKFAGVKAFLHGIRPVVVGLIVSTGILLVITVIINVSHFGDPISFDWRALLIFAVCIIVHLLYKKIRKKTFPTILLILLCATLGIVLYGPLGFI